MSDEGKKKAGLLCGKQIYPLKMVGVKGY